MCINDEYTMDLCLNKTVNNIAKSWFSSTADGLVNFGERKIVDIMLISRKEYAWMMNEY